VLWSAPCDLDTAKPLVDAYTRSVNEAVATRSVRGGGAGR